MVGELSAPVDVLGDILARSGMALTVQTIGTLPGICRFDGVVTDYQQARVLLDSLAFQCRSWFRMIGGQAVLRVRTDPVTAVSYNFV